MPKRIQRSRAKGWQMPEGAVYVGRPTRWGNPFLVGSSVQATPSDPIAVCFSATEAVETYRSILAKPSMAAFRADVMRDLRGKDLACWCALDQPCHADVLLEIANEPDSETAMTEDPFHEPPAEHFYDGVRYGTAPEMIAEIKALRAQLTGERERIADALDEEADLTPCDEDAEVTRSNARLVRANFDYEEADRLAEAEENHG